MESVLPQALVRPAKAKTEKGLSSPEAIPAELADFDAVANSHQAAIFRLILASVRDRDAAETLTQECLIRAYEARKDFRGEASVRSWLIRIAINLVRNHLRSARLKFWRRTQRQGIDAGLAADW